MHVIASPMAGTVSRLLVQAGDVVTVGQEVVILESMKMEIPVLSPKAGTIRSSVGHSRTGAHRPHGLLIVVDSSSKRPLSRLPMTAVGNAVSARVRRPC